MDEVLQLFFVLIRLVVWRVAVNAALLNEVLARNHRIARGAKSKLGCGLGGRKRTAPSQYVEELWRQKSDPSPADCERGQPKTDRREQWRVQLASGIEQLRERLRRRRRDVVRTRRASPRRQVHGLDAVVAVDELQRGGVSGHGRH